MQEPDSYWIHVARRVQLDWLRVIQGRADEVIEASENAPRGLGDLDVAHLGRALCYVDLDRLEQAREALGRALQVNLKGVAGQGWLFAHSLATEVAYRTGESTHAGWLDRLAPFHDRLVMQAWFVVCRGLVSHRLGQLAALRGSWDLAVEHLEAGLRRHQRLEAAPFVAVAKLAERAKHESEFA